MRVAKSRVWYSRYSTVGNTRGTLDTIRSLPRWVDCFCLLILREVIHALCSVLGAGWTGGMEQKETESTCVYTTVLLLRRWDG